MLSRFVLAELDDLIDRHAGADAQRALLSEVSASAYELVAFERGDIARATRVLERYADLALGLAAASIVVLSERLRVTTLLNLDRRHFRTLRVTATDRFAYYLSIAETRRRTEGEGRGGPDLRA